MGHIVGSVVSRRFVAGDPHLASVVFHSKFDGADGSTTITDEKGHTVTAVGNAQLDTAQQKFGTASLLLDGSGDSITCADSDDWNLGSGSFTIEGFVRFNNKDANSGNQVLVSQYNSTGNQRAWYLRLTGGNTLTAFASGNGTADGLSGQLAASWTPSNNIWYYLVFERSGNDWFIGVDNTQLDTFNANVPIINSTEVLRFGAFNSSGAVTNFVDGWLDEWRITKGVARYGGSYTVPTAAFPTV